jgi:hypothetical protein
MMDGVTIRTRYLRYTSTNITSSNIRTICYTPQPSFWSMTLETDHIILLFGDYRENLLTFTSPESVRLPVRHQKYRNSQSWSPKRSFPFPDFHVDRLITAKDHASIQIQIADVGADGKALKTSTTIALCGQVRSMGEADDSINRLATQKGGELSAVLCGRGEYRSIREGNC